MFLLIDNYDSFTYNLVQYFAEFTEVQVVRNDELTVADILALEPDAIVLSPGPSNPDEAGISLEVVEKLRGEIPIIGVCLGHQIVGQAYGANVVKGAEPVHGKQFLVEHDGTGMFEGIESPTEVGRYHSLVVEESTLPAELVVTARTLDGVVMGLRDELCHVETVQFHPESVLTPAGKKMIENAVKGVVVRGKRAGVF